MPHTSLIVLEMKAHTKCQWNEVSDDLCYNGDCRHSHHEAQHI